MIVDEKNWNLLRAEITFEEYVNCDTDIMTLEFCAVDYLIDNKLMSANLSDNEKECEEIGQPSFKEAINYSEKLRTLFIRMQVKKLFMNWVLIQRNAIHWRCVIIIQDTLQ